LGKRLLPDDLTQRSRSRRRRFTIAALAFILLGGAFRLYLAATLPVGYDEIFVMGLGLDAARESPADILLEIPLTRSTALAPLWWWVQGVSAGLGGTVSLIGLRVLPIGLGCATLLLVWRVACRNFGRRTGLILLAFAALSDILSFTNARGEFAESLTVPLILLLVCGLGSRPRPLRIAAVGGLLLLTVLVKGLFVLGLFALASAVAIGLSPSHRATRARGLLLGLGLALVPTCGYLWGGHLHFEGRTIEHDALTAGSIPELVHGILFDYTQYKAHVTGSARDAAFVALDLAVWPATVLTIPLLLAAAIASVHGFFTTRSRSRLAALRAALLVWLVVGGGVVIARGTLGARFHLMVLPAGWLLAALWLARVRTWRRTWPLALLALLGGVYVGICAGWRTWAPASFDARQIVQATLIAWACLAVILLWARRERGWSVARFGLGIATLVALNLCLRGPVAWGYYAAFEPMPGGTELAQLDAMRSGSADPPAPRVITLHFALADYYLAAAPDTPANACLGFYHAELAVGEWKDQSLAWALLGDAYLRCRQDAESARDVWRLGLQYAPHERLVRRLHALDQAPSASSNPN
jgi:hypothetical protein